MNPRFVISMLAWLILPGLSAQSLERPQNLRSIKPRFSHQYTFLDDSYYYFIDTTFNNLRWYRTLNNAFADDYGQLVLSNQGGARNNLLLPPERSLWQLQTQGPFADHFIATERVPFYHTYSPLTEAQYVQGFNRGQTFNIYHTQNVTPNWNFFFRYRRLNSLGFYSNNQNKMSSFLANTQFQSNDGRYKVKTYFASEELEIQEYGGLANDSAFEENLQTTRNLLLTNLTDVRTQRHREFFIRQEFDFLKAKRKEVKDSAAIVVDSLSGDTLLKMPSERETKRRSFILGHQFRYQRLSQVYAGNSSDFYDNYFNGTGNYRDSVATHLLDNYAYLKFSFGDSIPWQLKAGVRHLYFEYLNDQFQFSNQSLGLSGQLQGTLFNLFELKSELDYALTGSLANTFSLANQLELNIWRFKAFGRYRFALQYPELYTQFYRSNNFVWQNDFDPVSEGRLTYGLQWSSGGQIEITHFNTSKFVYFAADARPAVAGETVRFTQISLLQNFTFWDLLHFDNRLTYQRPTSGAQFMPLPDFLSRNSLYFNFKKFLGLPVQCILGGEVFYHSAFFSPSYSPATGRFYVADEKLIGDYPYWDAFIQFKIQKARVFVRYQHVNEGWNGYRYYAAPNYPRNDRVFRVGASWRFFN